ncbi:hypothetical protein FRC17_002352, partial [Serendipita sp. 399]
MALTLASLLILTTAVKAIPMPQDDPNAFSSSGDPQATAPTPTTTAITISCKAQYISQKDDTCRSIGLPWGLYDYQILEANSFLNCDDIWEGTPICIPDIPLPSTVVYPTTVVPVPTCRETYTSVEKDTCDSIGTHYGLSGNDIYQANTFLNCNDIWPYTPICIPYVVIIDTFPPPPSTTTSDGPTPTPPICNTAYVSVKDDTCDSIARNHGLVGSDIAAANSFLNCNDIWPNTYLCIPPVSSVPGCKHWYIADTSYPEPGHTITCADVGRVWLISAEDVYNSNTFVNCDDIWP